MGQSISSTSPSARSKPAKTAMSVFPTSTNMANDPIFCAALKYYLRGESMTSILNDDRLLRSDEGVENYCVGGYHSVHRGQLYNQRYMIVSKLGWGHFSTVWLAADLHTFTANISGPPCHHVALKIQKGESSYMEAALDEVKLLKSVGQASMTMTSASPLSHVPVTQMLDSFLVIGPNGKHMCTVFEVLGENLLQLLKRAPNRRLPLFSVKQIARDILRGLDFLHRHCHIIHTDLKPENVLISTNDPRVAAALAAGQPVRFDSSRRHEGQPFPTPVVKIADLGNACWTDHHFTDYITTRQYRSPEIILKAQYGCATDIWSLGCLCFELITGDYLFDPSANKPKGYSRNDDHLALMLELMGPAPSSLTKGAATDKYFDSSGRLARLPSLDYWPLHDLLHEKHNFSRQESIEIAAFLRPMLQLDPARRVTAQVHVQHSWLRTEMPSTPSRQDSFVVNINRSLKVPQPFAVKPSSTYENRPLNGPNRVPANKSRRSVVVPRLLEVPPVSSGVVRSSGQWRESTIVPGGRRSHLEG